MPEPWQTILLFGVAVVAGFVDSIAGGGGMITLPALLGCGFDPRCALGTNKLQATFGSGGAAWHFARAGHLDPGECARGAGLTLLGAAAGALAVQWLGAEILGRLIPLLLVAVAAVLAFRPRFGTTTRQARWRRGVFDAVFGLGIGFYDGFFGPGTGTFWAMAFVACMGFDLVKSTAQTKAMNFASNVAALAVFAASGQVDWTAGLVMGSGQWLGARLGSRMVIRRGTSFVRLVLLAVVIALAVKLWWRGS